MRERVSVKEGDNGKLTRDARADMRSAAISLIPICAPREGRRRDIGMGEHVGTAEHSIVPTLHGKIRKRGPCQRRARPIVNGCGLSGISLVDWRSESEEKSTKEIGRRYAIGQREVQTQSRHSDMQIPENARSKAKALASTAIAPRLLDVEQAAQYLGVSTWNRARIGYSTRSPSRIGMGGTYGDCSLTVRTWTASSNGGKWMGGVDWA